VICVTGELFVAAVAERRAKVVFLVWGKILKEKKFASHGFLLAVR